MIGNKINLSLVFFGIILSISLLYFLKNTNENQPAIAEIPKKKIAVCPTFFNLLRNNSELSSLEIIKTKSTAESLSVLDNNLVDYSLAGRILKPEEKKFPYKIIGAGFSFMSENEITLKEEDLKKEKFYTDLDVENLKNIFKINQLEKVESVYEYSKRGIIITSWENTNYEKAQIVHILNEDGTRNILSRIPIIYCKNFCEEEFINKLNL
jgi:hypothetical protein